MVLSLLATYIAPIGGAWGTVGSYLGVPALLSSIGWGTTAVVAPAVATAAVTAPAVTTVAAGGVLGAIGSYLGIPTILSAIGFGSSGVAAGSIAAGVQSSFGSVAAGSWFATLTSAGMAGAGYIVAVPITICGAIVGAMFGMPFL